MGRCSRTGVETDIGLIWDRGTNPGRGIGAVIHGARSTSRRVHPSLSPPHPPPRLVLHVPFDIMGHARIFVMADPREVATKSAHTATALPPPHHVPFQARTRIRCVPSGLLSQCSFRGGIRGNNRREGMEEVPLEVLCDG